ISSAGPHLNSARPKHMFGIDPGDRITNTKDKTMTLRPYAALLGLIVGIGLVPTAWGKQPPPVAPADPIRQRLHDLEEAFRFCEEPLALRVDEQTLFHRLEDLAEVDRVRYTGPPPRVIKNPTAQGAGNPVILTAHTFLPKKRLPGSKLPLVVFVHGGVHGNL